jgi:hypothetical protein
MKLINRTFDAQVLNDNFRDARGKDRSVNYEDSENELNDLLGGAYENERTYQPRKQNMHIRWRANKKPKISWWDERPGKNNGVDARHQLMVRLDGIMMKSIGRDADETFSKIVHLMKTNKDYKMILRDTPHEWFAGNFRSRYYPHTTVQSEFYIDERGRIGRNIRKGHARWNQNRRKDIITYEGPEPYYEVNLKHLEDMKPVIALCASDVFSQLRNGIINQDTAHRVRSEMECLFQGARKVHMDLKEGRKPETWNAKRYEAWMSIPQEVRNGCNFSGYYGNWWFAFDYIFTKVDKRVRTVIKYGTPEWKRAKRDGIQRSRVKPDHSKYDRSLAVQRWMSKHRGLVDRYDMTFHKIMEDGLVGAVEEYIQENFGRELKGRWLYWDEPGDIEYRKAAAEGRRILAEQEVLK